MSILSLSLLGPFEASLDERPLHKFRTSKVQALLIYLATEASVVHRRDGLMALLWPGLPQKSVQVNLRQTLYRLRQAIPEVMAKDGEGTVPFLLSDRQTVEVNPDGDVQVDVARFGELLSHDPTPERLAEAVALYRGDFLADFYLPDSDTFEDWAAARRAELQRQVLEALEVLSDHHIAQGSYDQAQAYAWRQLALDDLRESAHRQLMVALTHGGQRSAALAQYQICRKRLRDELGVEPSAETSALYEQIQADALRESLERRPRPAPIRGGMPVFLFTDIEGSTPLWETHREEMLPALLRHNEILEEQIARHGGRILELRGDGVMAVFEGADPLPCVLAIQRAFGEQNWGAVGEVRIRVGLHGVPPEREGQDYFLKGDQYYGPALHLGARVMDVGHGGQILVSERVRNSFPLPPEATWRDWGEYELRGVEEPQRILGLLHPDLVRQEFPPLRAPTMEAEQAEPLAEVLPVERSTPRHNLPAQSTPFIGREEELVELDDLIADPDVRLVTIAGPGGIGKTRLALAAAERQVEATEDGAPRFPHGAFFVPLAPLSSTEHIVPAVAEALSFPLRGEEGERRTPKQQVLDYLREKRLLLIMDNFEHLLDGADLVTDILQEAPDVQVLVTSRERLLLHEEQMYPIRGLEFPDWETPEDAAQYTAARLFLQSARRVRPDFEPVADDPTYLTRICRLVEGMPLAVELAAAWVDTLSLADIAAEIQRSLDFLETEWRDVPARHRSIRAVFDTSWQQMDPVEQAVFPQLSVFRGGFAREAAEQIGTTHDGSPASLRLLLRLTNKSLLQYDRARDRYDIHELLRQCGAEKLAASPEAEAAVRDRHSAYYCAALQRWEADLKGSRTQEALDKIDADIDNVRTAWEWAAGQGQVSQLDQAMDGLCLFYWQRYRLFEGIAACQLAADMLAQADPAATVPGDSGRVLAKALAWQGFFHAWQGNKRLAEPLLRQSSDLLDSPALSDCDTRQERALLFWAMGQAAAPDWEQWRRAWERSASLYRALGDQWWAATVLGWWGRIETWTSGDLETVRRKYEESLALFQSLDHRRGITEILLRLGELARETCDYDEAQRTFEEGLALSRAQGDLWGEALSLTLIGALALFQGQFENGRDSLERAVEIRQQVGDRHGMADNRSTCGTAHWFCGRYAEADSLLEQSLATSEAAGDILNKIGAITLQGEVRAWAGRYQEARGLARTALADTDVPRIYAARAQRVLGWVALGNEAYAEARGWLAESVAGHRELWSQYAREWLAVTLPAAARAELGLGNRAEAQAHLVEALEIILEIRAYIPLLFLMPIAPLLLVEAGGLREVERAVELYALAESHPFVANSQLFEDIAGRHIKAAAAALPPDVVEAARTRGQALDWWEVAQELLAEGNNNK
jgi:predicted ATPase/DNA-binding SARP family transcriptional activator